MTRAISTKTDEAGDAAPSNPTSADPALFIRISYLRSAQSMNRTFRSKKDEYDVDFEDPRSLCLVRWNEMTRTALSGLTPSEEKEVKGIRDDTDILLYIDKKLEEPSSDQLTRNFLLQFKTLPRAFRGISSSFAEALSPNEIDFCSLWGLVLLNIKLSISAPSSHQLKQTTDWAVKLRRGIERFNRVYRLGSDDKHEASFALIEALDYSLQILVESVRYLRGISSRCIEDDIAVWKKTRDVIKDLQKDLDDVIQHLNDINNYSRANHHQLRNIQQSYDDERARFPILKVPYHQNSTFYGRDEELKELDKYLRPNKLHRILRTYSIYGRRGIGKTEIALEYCYRNASNFDAIFWIDCETTLTLRTSFTNMAISLNIPGSDSKRSHEENLLAVHKWFKCTKKTWLMVFDNDKESELNLRSYWPVGASGSILITSRDYYNFMKDNARKGATIRPFTEDQSWNLLLRLLGPQWSGKYQDGKMNVQDIDAAKAWIKELGGLALSILIASRLITNPKPSTGETIAETYSLFLKRRAELPPRQISERSPLIETLDALFDMTFKALSPNALNLLSVIALLSPDAIPIELFLPRKQTALDGKLEFAKQEYPIIINEKDQQTTLSSVLNLAPKLNEALEELSTNNLIRWDHRIMAVHRVVQEALNWNSRDELQSSFDSSVRLVHEAFPKQVQASTMYDDWDVCQNYITHAVHLAKRYLAYQEPRKPRGLDPTPELIELLSNATWYLYEMGDYDLSNEVVEIAKAACADKESFVYSLLCNTQGSNFSELNQMDKSRTNFEQTLLIREKSHGNESQVDVWHNLANLEVTSQNYDAALSYYGKTVQAYSKIGDSAAWKLGLGYLGMGRCHVGLANYSEARHYIGQAEQLFVRTLGADKHSMAHCHYAYGNVAFEEGLYKSAMTSYEACLAIATVELPLHPITTAAYYSLGCTEFEMGNVDRARMYLMKARNIAQLRSPNRDDGTVARILWKTAIVLRHNPGGPTFEELTEADDLLTKAYIARAALIASGEGAEPQEADLLDDTELDAQTRLRLDEESFDLLVPGFFR